MVGMSKHLDGVDACMKAITYSEFGGPEVLTLSEMDKPKVGPGEVRIRVRSAAVNPVDWKVAQGALDGLMHAEFPVIPGWDVAGVVDEVGLDTPEFAAGDEVFAYARADWLHRGTYAEYITVSVRAVARKPASLDWDQAAALPLAGLTAYQVLTRLGVGDGDTVLVHNASGGVGGFAVQIARHLGARVIGTASPANHDAVRELGAEPVAYGEGLVERVREAAPEGVSVVVDFIGGVTEQTMAVLADGGRHASIADPSVLAHGGAYMWVRPDAADLATLAGLADEGVLRVDIARTFDLQEAADAWRLAAQGHTRGKIALRVSR